MNLGSPHLLDRHLNDAGVKDWYGRLLRARADKTGQTFDRVWGEIKDEYYQRTGFDSPPQLPIVEKSEKVSMKAYGRLR